MVDVVITLAAIYVVLLVNEYLWRRKILKGEAARKFVHIAIGIYGATWPFYLGWREIQILGLLAVVFILFMRVTGLFKSVYAIERRSWGDLIAPGTIVLLAWLEPSEWVFMAAVLHIALADGFAAIIGSKYAKRSHYKIVGNTKSLIGTLTFWVVSFGILFAGATLSTTGLGGLTLPLLLWLSAGAAYLENISPYGFDNFFVPMLVYVVLQPLQAVY